LTKEGRQALGLERYVKNLADVISARTHLHRERFLWWILCPTFVLCVLACLCLVVADALGLISPMRPALLAAVTAVVSGGVVSTGAGAGFSLLKQASDEENPKATEASPAEESS
jgi:hypothetical protein